MARPVVSETAEETYAGLVPWTAPDEFVGYHLLHFVQALTARLEALNAIVRDRDGELGWSSVLDLERAAPEHLAWLAQFLGVDLSPNLTTEQQKASLLATAGFRRGTKAAIAGAAQRHLTGRKVVQITERDGSPYRFTVRTFAAETPDEAAVLLALKAAKPAGLLMNYEVISGATYGELRDTGWTYSELSEEYPTYLDMKSAVPPAV